MSDQLIIKIFGVVTRNIATAILTTCCVFISIVGNAEPHLYYVHNDHLGTAQVITDQTQQIVWKANYQPFGDVELEVNNVDFPLRFPGQYYDEETGLYYNYYRDYDPTAGRYIQSDPIGLRGGVNTYAYVSGNPLRRFDPYGLIEESLNPAGAVAGLAMIAAAFSGNQEARDLFSELGDAIADAMNGGDYTQETSEKDLDKWWEDNGLPHPDRGTIDEDQELEESIWDSCIDSCLDELGGPNFDRCVANCRRKKREECE